MRILTAFVITAALAAAESGSKTDQARQFIKRARETADVSWLARAEETIRGVDDFDSNKVRVQILLGREEWSQAAELASKLNKKMPDDPLLYALMADAYIALGDYARAEKEVQFLIDLRRTSPAAFVRGAQLREVFGDTDGAMEWFTQAYRLTSATDTEERARILTLAARMNKSIGKTDLADKYLTQALKLQPGYPLAIAQQAPEPGPTDPAEVLRAASEAYSHRKDIATACAYAWALHNAGRSAEALPIIESVVKLGTKDLGVAAHAKAIRDAVSKAN